MKLNVLSIGGSVRDVLFYTSQAELVKNPKNKLKQKLFAFEFGAKIYSKNVFFSLGGGAANSSVNFSYLGLKVAIYTRLGSDFNSKVIFNEIRKKKVITKYITMDDKLPSGFSFLVVDVKTGEHTTFAYRGANDSLNVKPVQLNKINTDWYYITSLSGNNWNTTLNNIYGIANSKKIKVAWNPGSVQLSSGYKKLSKYFKKTEVFNVNMDEAIELVISKNKKFKNYNNIKLLLKEIKNWGSKIIVITNGRKGVYVYDGKRIYFQKALSNPPIDTTGAGDCFGSSFITGIIRFQDIQKAMKLGIATTASLVTKVGAQQGLITWNRAIKNMKKI